MEKEIYIVGAGGLGREICMMMLSVSGWIVKGFFDDGILPGTTICGLPVLGGISSLLERNHDMNLSIAIGNPVMKSRIATALKPYRHLQFPVLVHPSATIYDPSSVELQPGSIISAGCVLTTGIVVGEHVLVNLNATIGHDTKIGDDSSIMPGVNLAGNVTIGKRVLIGSGANVLNNLSIGDGARIGAGAVVTKDVPSDVTVVGVPGKIVKGL